MKVVIMAGGLGKRIANVDPTIPKPLLPISGKPILQWEIECLVRQGLNEIIITVSHMAEKIQDYFGDGTKFGCNIEYYIEEQLLGNAGALFRLWEERRLDGDFLLLNADSMFDVDFKRFIAFHEKKRDKEQGNKGQDNKGQHDALALATLFTHPNNHPYDSTLIVANPETHVIEQWLTKDDERPAFYKNCVNAGLHILNTELLELSGIDPASIDSAHKIDLDRGVLKPAVASGRIYSYSSPEYVKDMGTPDRFQQVCADLESGKVHARNLSTPQKAIFLDRDGTINWDVGFLKNINDFELLPRVSGAIKSINASEYLAIVITNQPVIARGEITVEGLQEIHNKMETLLGNAGAYIDALYYCPHHPDKGFDGEVPELKIDCNCRKPKPGMLLQAAKDFNIDLGASWMIGDSERDIEAGKAAGCKTCLIGKQIKDYGQNNTAHSLFKAIDLIMKRYTIQNFHEAYSQLPAYQMTEEDFFKAKNAYNICLILLWIEEKFEIISQNYYEWEKEIKDSYDFFLANQDSSPDCNKRQLQFGHKEIIIHNRRLNNFLSSVRLYQDQTLKNLSSLEKLTRMTSLEGQFKKKTNELYDRSLAYQIMEFIRNYMQHQGLIVTKLTVFIPFFNRVVGAILPYHVEIDINELRSVKGFDNKINRKRELNDLTDKWLNLIGLVREYYKLLVELHDKLREITSSASSVSSHSSNLGASTSLATMVSGTSVASSILGRATGEIHNILEKYYKDSAIPSFAFESSETNETFLLQKTYLKAIEERRKEDYQLRACDCERDYGFYIEAEAFKDSNKVKDMMKNFATVEVIYNQS